MIARQLHEIITITLLIKALLFYKGFLWWLCNQKERNDEKITDVGFTVTKDVCIDGKFIIIRRGKKNYYIGVFE